MLKLAVTASKSCRGYTIFHSLIDLFLTLNLVQYTRLSADYYVVKCKVTYALHVSLLLVKPSQSAVSHILRPIKWAHHCAFVFYKQYTKDVQVREVLAMCKQINQFSLNNAIGVHIKGWIAHKSPDVVITSSLRTILLKLSIMFAYNLCQQLTSCLQHDTRDSVVYLRKILLLQI